ncbi:hypothetical protein J4458_03955 [Candidatus Woesearchaeota archaeon]|nr:hypothetical protein [Candidatus Woesearchaeota archaeon]
MQQNCNSNQNCENAQCVLKSGCAYNNPSCSANYDCVNNQCILRQGCDYNNPPCGSGQVCQNNACVAVCQDTSWSPATNIYKLG